MELYQFHFQLQPQVWVASYATFEGEVLNYHETLVRRCSKFQSGNCLLLFLIKDLEGLSWSLKDVGVFLERVLNVFWISLSLMTQGRSKESAFLSSQIYGKELQWTPVESYICFSCSWCLLVPEKYLLSRRLGPSGWDCRLERGRYSAVNSEIGSLMITDHTITIVPPESV